MDELHEFREDINDGSMCLCGIPANYHDEWEMQTRVEQVYAGVPSRRDPAALIRTAVVGLEEWSANRVCPNRDQWLGVQQELLLLASEYGG